MAVSRGIGEDRGGWYFVLFSRFNILIPVLSEVLRRNDETNDIHFHSPSHFHSENFSSCRAAD
jgi:hypothetical protein